MAKLSLIRFILPNIIQKATVIPSKRNKQVRIFEVIERA